MNRLFSISIATLFIGFAVFARFPADAQEGRASGDTKKAIYMPPGQLITYEGYFQFSQSKDQVIQFKIAGDTLVAKLLWNGMAIHIVPESDSIFHNVEPVEGRTIPIKFIRNSDGVYTKTYFFDQSRSWDRIKDYKPLERKEIAHTPEQLKAFEGTYSSQGNRLYLRIMEKQNKLVLHPYWGGDDVEFLPDSAMHFFCRDQLLFTLQFEKGADGSVTKMIAFGRDRWEKAKSLSLTPDKVKAFEGKYQLKEDPDDIIQVKASGMNLILRQLWDGKETTVSPRTDVFFYNEEKSYLVTFKEDDAGTVAGAFILGNDYFEKMKN